MPLFVQTFDVMENGGGTFPHDMLRYDACFPHTSDDAVSISLASHTRQVRNITLRRYVQAKTALPTVDRWKSFGWTVMEQSIGTRKV